MKKSKLIPVLVLASTFVMAGCGDNNEKCSHVDGNKDHLCDKCGEKISDHSAKSEWKFDSVNHWHECSFDGCSVMVDKAAHSFGEWQIVTQPTFESAGQMKRSCSCGYSQVKGIPQLIHEYDLEVWNHDEHTHWHACKDSGYENLKAFESEHEFGKLIVDKEPTCNEDGSGHYICSVCGEMLDVVIPATGHVNVKFHPEFAPTCTHAGHKAYYTCANEPGVYYEDEECTIVIDDISIAKLAHVPERHEAVAPTCDNPGNKEYWTCANEPGVLYADEACSVKVSEDDVIIPATGHDPVHHDAVEPTCTEDGYVEHWTCKHEEGLFFEDEGCTTLIDDIVVPAIGHDKVHHEAVPATCTKDGTIEYWTCNHEEGILYGDAELTTVITDIVDPATGHKSVHHEAVPATCDKDGTIEYWTCDNEPGVFYGDDQLTKVITDIVDPATGHNFDEAWSSDNDNHWHECLNDNCDEVSDLGAHADDNNDHLCDECEFVMSDHDFEDTWSNANGQHFHKCKFEGCAEVADAADHIDEDLDGYCDVCNSIMPKVNSISLDYITGYIGAGESVVLTADVNVTGDAPKDVEWHLEKSNGSSWSKYASWDVTDVFTLVDNGDGTATLSGVMMEYTAEFSCYVYATSKFDDSVSSNKTEKIYYQTWNNTKRGTLNDFFGDGQWQTIPFFPTTTLSLSSDGVKLTGKSTSRKIAQMINSFDNQGTWTKVSASDTTAKYTLTEGYASYECVISKNTSSTSYGQFVITKSYSIPEEFLGVYSFVARDDYGNVDMPVLVNVTDDGATLIAYASDGIYEHKCSAVNAAEGVVSFSQGTSYSDLNFTLESNDGLIFITEIAGSWFDGYTWSATLPATLSTDALRIVVADDSIQNGSVSITSDAGTSLAPVGATVEFQVTAASGYEIDTVTLSESGVELKELYGGKYSFVMPDADLVISATFKEKAGPSPVEFDWSTYVGSFTVPVEEYGMMVVDVTFDCNNMTVTWSDYPDYSYPCTADFNGCSTNQIHLSDPDGAFDIIVEYNGSTFIVVE